MEHQESALISRFTRTDGDGMESMQLPITSDVKSSIDMLKNINLSSPTKSPSAQPDRVINLIPNKVASPASASSSAKYEVKALKSTNSSSSLDKKARFIPYEPYKAAVKPMIPMQKKVQGARNKRPSTDEQTLSRRQSNDGECSSVSSSHISSVLQEDYNKILKEKSELEEELKIQIKVNSELKRLLVASVGEDMEARVHFLTEDKVKLGDDIRQYVERIAHDFEQKEKLSIESDIWRSKFLASSVIIEELTKWKTVLCSRNDDLQVCIKGLLDEMKVIQHNNKKSFNHIKALNKAFDPLGNSGRKSPETMAGSDVVETSHSTLQLAESLSKRLLGTYTQIRDDPTEGSATAANCIDDKLSNAQLAAKGVLTSHPAGQCSMSELASDVTAYTVQALARRSMNKSFFSCCPHCTGQVHII